MRVLPALVVVLVGGGCSVVPDLPDFSDLPAPPSPRRLLSRGGGGAAAAPTAVPAPAPTPTPQGGARPPESPTFESIPSEDQRTFEAANAVRRERRLPPFRWNARLYAAALAHSEDQERNGYMGHRSPDPRRRDLADRLRLAGYTGAQSWAEVVAKGYTGPESVMHGWMTSRGHRKILVDPTLQEAAFARVGRSFTGNFGTPAPRGR